MAQLHAVPPPAPAAAVAINAAQRAVLASRDLWEAIGDVDKDDLDGEALVLLRQVLVETIDNARQTLTDVNARGNRWCWDHGHDRRGNVPICRIGDKLYRPVLSGQATSLKVADKRRLWKDAGRPLADWMIARLGLDNEDASTVEAVLSIALVELGKAFNADPLATALAAGLDDEHPAGDGVPWAINVADYRTEANSNRVKGFEEIEPAQEGDQP